MLFSFDQWLLDKFEQFSHKSQLWIGKNCFWWARLTLILYFLFLIIPKPLYVEGETWKLLLRIRPFAVMVGLAGLFVMRKEIKEIEKKLSKLVGGYINAQRLNWKLRILIILITLVVSIIGPLETVWYLCAICFVSTMYFMACTPLPPAPSKLKEWLKNKLLAVKKLFAPIPQPVPVPCPI